MMLVLFLTPWDSVRNVGMGTVFVVVVSGRALLGNSCEADSPSVVI